MGLAVDGLVSFSSSPLRLVTHLGLTSAAIALGLAIWVFVDAYTQRTAPRGWASTIVVVLFMGSVQLICLGIIGEYIRLIFVESKGRPLYIVDRYQPAASADEPERDAGPRSGASRKAPPPRGARSDDRDLVDGGR